MMKKKGKNRKTSLNNHIIWNKEIAIRIAKPTVANIIDIIIIIIIIII